jgi:hypothetical protein
MTLASFRSHVHRRRSLAWLLALLLWLPVAQWAAAAHALLHVSVAAAADDPERPAHLPGSCDTCVVAAAIGGAAPQSAPAIAVLPRLAHVLPQAPADTALFTLFAAAYRSRAPPSLHA